MAARPPDGRSTLRAAQKSGLITAVLQRLSGNFREEGLTVRDPPAEGQARGGLRGPERTIPESVGSLLAREAFGTSDRIGRS